MICSENGLKATALFPPSAAVSATEVADHGLIGRTQGVIPRACATRSSSTLKSRAAWSWI